MNSRCILVYRAWLNSRAINTDKLQYLIIRSLEAYDTNYGVYFLIISYQWKLR